MTSESNAARIGRIVSRVAKLVPAASTLGGVGAIVALAPNANATIVQSPIPQNLPIPVDNVGIYINVLTGVFDPNPALVLGWDINPWSAGSLLIWSDGAGGIMTAPGGSTTLTGNLPLGTLVDGTGIFGQSNLTQFTSGAIGEFQFNATNYIGFKFFNEVDSSTHFGWASIILGPTATDPSRNIFQIWYEDQANTGILVGDTGPAPEPSTAALLALGVAGLLAMRRRRRASR
jgi:hypothetical protein